VGNGLVKLGEISRRGTPRDQPRLCPQRSNALGRIGRNQTLDLLLTGLRLLFGVGSY